MTYLSKLRDEMAEKYARNMSHHFGNRTRFATGFKAGFDAAIKALTDASGEFDYLAAVNASALYDANNRGGYELFKDGAEWQHSQDRARIGLAELNLQVARFDNNELKARVRELEAAQRPAFGTQYDVIIYCTCAMPYRGTSASCCKCGGRLR